MVSLIAMQGSDQSSPDGRLETLRAQCEAAPHDPALWHQLGTTCAQTGHHDDAVRAFAQAARLKPEWAEPCFGLAAVLAAIGQDDAAITAFRSALELDPSRAQAQFDLARLLEKRGNASDAISHYIAAGELRADWPEPHLYRGALHEARGEYTDSASAYEQAIRRGAPPGFALRRDLQVPIIAASADSYQAAREEFESRLAELLKAPPAVHDPVREAGGNRFFLAYHGLNDRPLQEDMVRLFRRACPSLDWTAPHCRETRPPAQPRRIGVASRFLHDHSIGRLMIGLLEHLHMRSDCTVFLYHAVAPPDDSLRRDIEQRADHVAILPSNLQESREHIAADRLDLLFYPDIGMDPVTYFLAQSRLAPVQAATWGHPVTTGMPTIDYYLSCDAAEPDDAEDHYSETLVRLGGLPFSYRRPARPDPLGTRADFGLSEDGSVYFLAQNLFKIHPDMDAALAAILQRDSTGRILLLEGQDQNWGRNLRERFQRSIGDASSRIQFLPRQSHDNYMRLLALSDVSLDSFPFCGGNTTYQALAMGTPVVTLPGRYLRGRLSLAIYHHMGMMDCVAQDPTDFAEIAVRLGTDDAFRQRIEAKISASDGVIFNDPVFLEDAQAFLLEAAPKSGH